MENNKNIWDKSSEGGRGLPAARARRDTCGGSHRVQATALKSRL